MTGYDGTMIDAGSTFRATIDPVSGMATIENMRGERIATGLELKVDYKSSAQGVPLTREFFCTAGKDVLVYNPVSSEDYFSITDEASFNSTRLNGNTQ